MPRYSWMPKVIPGDPPPMDRCEVRAADGSWVAEDAFYIDTDAGWVAYRRKRPDGTYVWENDDLVTDFKKYPPPLVIHPPEDRFPVTPSFVVNVK
jgi:hypothetical protein